VLHGAENTSAKTKPAEKLLALRKHASVINLESENGFVTTQKKENKNENKAYRNFDKIPCQVLRTE